jgi:putative phosphoribosyl transferase
MTRFSDRREAGRLLASQLLQYAGEHPVVIGLPRGGVPVAAEVARRLDAPLDVIVVRKLGVPFQPELGMGAVGEGGVLVVHRDIVRSTGVGHDDLRRVEARERAEVERRARDLRGDRPHIPLAGRTVIVVDDGIATGGTARAAVQVAHAQGARRVILAVPVAPPEVVRALREEADEVVCLQTPEPFLAVGRWYDDFAPVDDRDVVDLLAATAAAGLDRSGVVAPDADDEAPDDPPARDEDVEIHMGPRQLGGRLTVPDPALGMVLFAHGSGSSRHSPRNRFVARVLNDAGIATLLFDLLTPDEELDRPNVFDIELLADRLAAATRLVRSEADGLRIGYFGASTGAAAALWAAADPVNDVAAVVSRGGRPDLATTRLHLVTAPTLLVVGGRDDVVLGLNQEAARHLRCEHRVEIVPGATHLFEEPGTLEAAAALATGWFTRHLAVSG